MSWLIELFLDGLWQGLVEVAWDRWGWPGGIIALLAPVLTFAAALWLLA